MNSRTHYTESEKTSHRDVNTEITTTLKQNHNPLIYKYEVHIQGVTTCPDEYVKLSTGVRYSGTIMYGFYENDRNKALDKNGPTIELLDHDGLPYFNVNEKVIMGKVGSISLPICKATDNYDVVECVVKITNPSVNPSVAIPLENLNKAGTYLVTYSASDSKGNEAIPVEVELQLAEGADGYTDAEKAAIDSHFEYDWDKLENDVITYEFKERVIKLSTDYGPTADEFMMIMFYESGISNTTVNQKGTSPSYATGLIQFMPTTAKSLLVNRKINGVSILDTEANTTLSELDPVTQKSEISQIVASVSAMDQLELVDIYLSWKNPVSDLSDLYMAILCPEAIGEDDDYFIYVKGVDGLKYTNNSQLDNNPYDEKISKLEATNGVISSVVEKVSKKVGS